MKYLSEKLAFTTLFLLVACFTTSAKKPLNTVEKAWMEEVNWDSRNAISNDAISDMDRKNLPDNTMRENLVFKLTNKPAKSKEIKFWKEREKGMKENSDQTTRSPNRINPTFIVEDNVIQAYGWVLIERKPVRGTTPAPVKGGEVMVNFGDDAIEMLLAKPYGNGAGGTQDPKNPQRLHARYSWSVPEVIQPGGQLVIVVKQVVLSNNTGRLGNTFGVGIMIQNNWSLKGKMNDGTVVEPWAFGIGLGRPDWAQKDAVVTYERTWLWNEGKTGEKRMVSVSVQGVGTQKFEYMYEWKPYTSQEVKRNPTKPQATKETITDNQSSVEMLVGDWDLVANGFAGTLEIRADGSVLKGRVYFKVYNKWEPLENLQFNPSTKQFTFYRPQAKQQHEGTLNGSNLTGTFNKTSKWTATKASPNPTTKQSATVDASSVEILVGDWDFVANGFPGILEIRFVGSSLQGRVNYIKNNKWEPLENLQFNPSTKQFSFYRPNGKQLHEGVLDGTTMKGTFTNNWKWSATKISQPQTNDAVSKLRTQNEPAIISQASVEMLVGDWDFLANGYAGTLEIRADGSILKGRVYFKVNKWEPLENLQFNPSTKQFTFYRPQAKQQYEGVLDGSTMKGTFNNNWKWSATKISQPQTSNIEKRSTPPLSQINQKKAPSASPQKIDVAPSFDGSVADIPPSKPLPFLDITTISKTEWDGAVSAAMEGMRLVYGPMNAEDNKKFVKSWAPLRQTPFKEAVDYLNKFNPLLGEFLTYRTSITQTGILLEEAVKNAGIAAEYDDPQLSFGYLDLATKYRNLLVSRQKRLQQITNDLIALGNPPDGAQMMADQQRRYKQEKDYLKGLVNNFEITGCWAGHENTFLDYSLGMGNVYKPIFIYIYKIPVNGSETYFSLYISSKTVFPENVKASNNYKLVYEISAYRDETWIRSNFKGKDVIILKGNNTNQVNPSITLNQFDNLNIPQFKETTRERYQQLIQETSKRITSGNPNRPATSNKDAGNPFAVEVSRAEDREYFEKWIKDITIAETFFKTAIRWTEENKWDKFDHSKDKKNAPKDLLKEFLNEMTAGSGELAMSKPQSKPQSTPKNTQEQVTDKSNSGENYLHVIDDKNPEDRKKIDIEAIEFHKTNLAIIQKNMERDQEDMAKEKDPIRQKDFEMRILGAQANLQSENDRIATIQTGIIVHNRSPWDDYAKSNFIQNIAENQQKMENISHGIRKAYEMADRLPGDEARAARAIINNKYNGTIMANLDEKAALAIINEANSVGKKYYQGKIDMAMADNKEAVAEAEWAESCLQTAEIVKKSADYTMMGLSLFGGKYVNNAYQGITGYIEGGPKEAFLRVANSYNTVTGVAVDGFRGFEGAVNQGGDIVDGVLSAGWEITKGLITEKAMSYGAGKISASFNRPNGDLPNVDGPIKTGKGVETNNTTVFQRNKTRAVEPDFNRPLSAQEIAVHRQQVADGRIKVNSYKNTFEKLETARKAGAPTSEIKKILIELDDRSAKIHSSPQAKMMMKTLQKQPKNLEMIKRYSNSMDRVHQKVEKRFQAEMEKNGWSPEELEAIRNKPDPAELKKAKENQAKGETVLPESLLGSKTVNMDYDAGRKVKLDVNGKPIPPAKNGKSVPIEAWQAEAQTAWEKSYKDQTGQIASHSWENITHGKMADAYADLSVLQKNGIKQANKEWAGQTADVSYYKAAHLSGSAEFKRVEKYVEIARGTSKDCKTKMMPLFEQKKPKLGTPSYDAWQKHKNYWDKVNGVLDNMGSGKKDPMTADREIREITGGKSVLEVTFDMRNFMESLMKLGNN